MTTQEFINEFDVLLNAQQQQFDGEFSPLQLDEYEKSVFLTQAEEEFVIAAYNGKNQYGYMFESDEESRRYLDSLITTVELEPIEVPQDVKTLTNKSKVFEAPEDLMFITYESAKVTDATSKNTCLRNKILEVVPVKQDEFHRVYENPFRGPNDRRVLRLDNTESIIELVSKYTVTNYTMRYVRRPKPIILVELDGGLTIRGEQHITNPACELEDVTHRMILQRAVSLALTTKGLNQRIVSNNNQ